ncbi:unnamed protein product [Echinostoma caproni]|uniref:Uncharacterized protein n=1 Tax=Echinostoma caproni TaxID=27848 RepID=A0A183A9Q9_9TREM|nr:unnamed protein product [Echinostoma caproni]
MLVITLFYLATQLPGVLMRSCQTTLRVLDLSGNAFDRSAHTEWSTFFSGTTALESLLLDGCHGLYFAETLRLILTGFGRLKRRPTAHMLQLQLSRLTLGSVMHSMLSPVLRTAIGSVITHLDLSQFGIFLVVDFVEAASEVFRNLESCVTLESLVVNGPWHNIDNRQLDISGNQVGSVEIENATEDSPTVPRILTRILAASNQLTRLAFDSNDLSLQEIEDLVVVAENYRGPLILATPICDLARAMEADSEKCKQLAKRKDK